MTQNAPAVEKRTKNTVEMKLNTERKAEKLKEIMEKDVKWRRKKKQQQQQEQQEQK